MEQHCHKFLILLFGIYLMSCSKPSHDTATMDDARVKEIESAVINRFNELILHAEAVDIERMLGMFDQSGPGTYTDGSHRYDSFQDMADSYRANFNSVKQDFGIPQTRLMVLSPNYAWVSSTANVSSADKSGISYQPRAWAASTLWILKDGQWQIHSFHQFAEPKIPIEEKIPVEEKKDM